jgi:adenine phosphoribosyltransferase
MTIDIKRYIAEVQDFPKPGILFRDISPLLTNPDAFRYTISLMVEEVSKLAVSAIVAIESRGFLFAAPVAHQMKIPLVLVRKAGKLPGDLVSVSYGLEYGSDTLEMKSGILSPGAHVAVIDDVLATGGTALAAKDLVHKVGGQVVSYLFLAELSALNGRSKLGPTAVRALVEY